MVDDLIVAYITLEYSRLLKCSRENSSSKHFRRPLTQFANDAYMTPKHDYDGDLPMSDSVGGTRLGCNPTRLVNIR
jgi:hypothetical protein